MTDTPPTPAAVALMLARTGLSQAEAARYLDVTPRTVARWLHGATYPSGAPIAPSPQHWQALQRLLDRQRTASEAATRMIRRDLTAASSGQPAAVLLVVPADDDAARARGWPSRGAHLALLARVVDRLESAGVPIRFTLSGSDEAAAIPLPAAPPLS